MANFVVSSQDASCYKVQIQKFWQDYLPETPENRFEWLLNNPAGPVIWFFATDVDTGGLAGVISVLPRDFFVNGKKIRAGILGDFMLHKNYRVFGPALLLLKAALETVEKGLFDFIYSLPNKSSTLLLARVGMKSHASLHYMVRPHHVDFLLEKKIGRGTSKLLDKFLMPIFKLFSRETYFNFNGTFEEIKWNDKSFDSFARRMKKTELNVLTGDCNLEYLEWRYRLNPENKFNIIVFRPSGSNEIQGYFVYTIVEQKFEIIDVVSFDLNAFLNIMKKIGKISQSNNCRGAYLLTNCNNELFVNVKKFLYMDSGVHAEVFTYPETGELFETWNFLSSDRNA